jgi:urea carboxylase
MRVFGLKHTARALAEAHGVPLLPGTAAAGSWQAALDAAAAHRLPGDAEEHRRRRRHRHARVPRRRGTRAPSTRCAAWRANFSDSGVFLEKYVERARHIEVQIFGDGQGE